MSNNAVIVARLRTPEQLSRTENQIARQRAVRHAEVARSAVS
ncbi:hypothetical protein [Pseudonocardia sp. KRD291]|nr:hypothetical protein [Pseudonocardia sp. KRD291]